MNENHNKEDVENDDKEEAPDIVDGFSKIHVGLHVDVDAGNECHGSSTEPKEQHDVEGEPREEADHPGPVRAAVGQGEDHQPIQ